MSKRFGLINVFSIFSLLVVMVVVPATLKLVKNTQDIRKEAEECYEYYYCRFGHTCVYAGDCDDFPGGFQECSDAVYNLEGVTRRCYLDSNCNGRSL